MSWRSVQLGTSLCDQDQLILKLFEGCKVKGVGVDFEFATNLQLDHNSENLILIINNPIWLSGLIDVCKKHLVTPVNNFYIGINRYIIRGNDTTIKVKNSGNAGIDIINFVSQQLTQQGYTTLQAGHFDHDQGRYFNFVQPLTWLYGTKTSNCSK